MNACQRVRGDELGDPGAASRLADDPPGGVPVQPPAVRGQEHRSLGPLADGQVDRPGSAWSERNRDDLGALAQDRQRPMTAFESEPVDVSAGRFRDA
jgi:hypothetical protein